MPWLQIRIPTTPNHTETLEDALLVAGCQAVTLIDTADQPVFEPIRGTTPLWQHTTVQGLFDSELDSDALKKSLQDLISSEGLQAGPVTTEILEDKDWERSWMDNFHPIQCGERLWIVPSWQDAPNASAVNLKLDPGLAFGTGTHPTTFLCLAWLDEHLKGGEQILDFGCGSGILGLAGLLLGAERMEGIDIDPQAMTATRNNAETNGISANRYQVTTSSEALNGPFEVVVANILAGTLIDLSDQLIAHTQPNGYLVLSGVLAHQADDVMAAFGNHVKFDPVAEKDGWVCITGQRVS